MRKLPVLLALLLLPFLTAQAEIRVSIGINLGFFPELVPVPGYPVYYGPGIDANYFFYDGLYWVYVGDRWYSSSWYDGPWRFVAPEFVPLYVLRVPVRYYRHPPAFFHGWRRDDPPRWGDHWGRGWEERRHGWDHWDRRAAPPPAPLPLYQREYGGERYPRGADMQRSLREQHYDYRPRDSFSRRQLPPPRTDRPARPPGGSDHAQPPHAPPRIDRPPSRPEHGRAEPQPRGGPEQRSRPEPRAEPRRELEPRPPAGGGPRGAERPEHGRESRGGDRRPDPR